MLARVRTDSSVKGSYAEIRELVSEMNTIEKLSNYRNALLFVLLALAWGTSFVAIETGLAVLPPVLFAALRFDVAGALLLAYALATTERRRPRERGEWLTVGVGAVLVIAAHFALLFVGQRYVTSGTAAIVLSTAPVLTPAFAWLLLPEERLGVVGALGALLGLVGVAVIAAPSPSAVETGVVGPLLLLGSAASFALGAVLVGRFPDTLPLATSQAWMMLLGAGLLHLVSGLRGEPGPTAVAWTPTAVVALGHLAVVCSAGGFLVYFDLLSRVGAVEISLVNYAVPVVAAVAGWALLGEPLSARTVAGFLVIVAGFALLKWSTVVRLQARYARGYAAENEYVPNGSALSGSRVVADD